MRTAFVAVSILGLGMVAGVGLGHAAPKTAFEATALLSQSFAINAKCHVLPDAERDELMDFLARAEIALAEQSSVKEARAAVAKGRTAGNASTCSTDDKQLVMTTLGFARHAQAGSQTQEAGANPIKTAPDRESLPVKAASTTVKPQAQADAQPVTAAVAVAEPPAEVKPKKVKTKKPQPVKAQVLPEVKKAPLKKRASSSSLSRYANVAQKYYVELKCRSMSGAAVKRLYANVLANHRKALAENDPAAVKSMLRAAEARAGSARCG